MTWEKLEIPIVQKAATWLKSDAIIVTYSNKKILENLPD